MAWRYESKLGKYVWSGPAPKARQGLTRGDVQGSPHAPLSAFTARRAASRVEEDLDVLLAPTRGQHAGRMPKLGTPSRTALEKVVMNVAGYVQGLTLGAFTAAGIRAMTTGWSRPIAQGIAAGAMIGLSTIETLHPAVKSMLIGAATTVGIGAIGGVGPTLWGDVEQAVVSAQAYMPPQFGGPPVLPAGDQAPGGFWQTWSDAWSVLGTQ